MEYLLGQSCGEKDELSAQQLHDHAEAVVVAGRIAQLPEPADAAPTIIRMETIGGFRLWFS